MMTNLQGHSLDQWIDHVRADPLPALHSFVTSPSATTTHTGVRPWLYGVATNLVGHHRRAEVRSWQVRILSLW